MKIKKILLLRPFYGITVHADMHGDLGIADHHPHVYPDVSFVNSATIVNQAFDTQLHVIDANLERIMPHDVWNKLDEAYDLIMVKTASPTIQLDIDFGYLLKLQFPAAKVVLTGHAAYLLADWIKQNRPMIDEIADVPIENFIYRTLYNKTLINPDQFPCPDYTLFPYRKFRDMDGNLRLSLSTSRGCSIGCTYCPYASFYGKQIEFRSLDLVINDIETLLSLGIKRILFRDPFFTANPKRIEILCKEIMQRGLKFKWECETRLESLSEPLIDRMTEAGMDIICFGVENASDQILMNYHRPPVNVAKTQRLIQYLKSKKVLTIAFYIIGFPQDNWQTIRETYELAVKLKSFTVKFSIYSPCTKTVLPVEKMRPDIFIPFENTMNLDLCSELNRKELNMLVNHLNNLYHTALVKEEQVEENYLECVFEKHIVHQENFNKFVRKLRQRVFKRNIFEAIKISNTRSNVNAYTRI